MAQEPQIIGNLLKYTLFQGQESRISDKKDPNNQGPSSLLLKKESQTFQNKPRYPSNEKKQQNNQGLAEKKERNINQNEARLLDPSNKQQLISYSRCLEGLDDKVFGRKSVQSLIYFNEINHKLKYNSKKLSSQQNKPTHHRIRNEVSSDSNNNNNQGSSLQNNSSSQIVVQDNYYYDNQPHFYHTTYNRTAVNLNNLTNSNNGNTLMNEINSNIPGNKLIAAKFQGENSNASGIPNMQQSEEQLSGQISDSNHELGSYLLDPKRKVTKVVRSQVVLPKVRMNGLLFGQPDFSQTSLSQQKELQQSQQTLKSTQREQQKTQHEAQKEYYYGSEEIIRQLDDKQRLFYNHKMAFLSQFQTSANSNQNNNMFTVCKRIIPQDQSTGLASSATNRNNVSGNFQQGATTTPASADTLAKTTQLTDWLPPRKPAKKSSHGSIHSRSLRDLRQVATSHSATKSWLPVNQTTKDQMYSQQFSQVEMPLTDRDFRDTKDENRLYYGREAQSEVNSREQNRGIGGKKMISTNISGDKTQENGQKNIGKSLEQLLSVSQKQKMTLSSNHQPGELNNFEKLKQLSQQQQLKEQQQKQEQDYLEQQQQLQQQIQKQLQQQKQQEENDKRLELYSMNQSPSNQKGNSKLQGNDGTGSSKKVNNQIQTSSVSLQSFQQHEYQHFQQDEKDYFPQLPIAGEKNKVEGIKFVFSKQNYLKKHPKEKRMFKV